ncbi:hypothetical protein GW17_00057961 [Ensete ventricosum]|nr:hypothetical protein GW17_00057961 [Ensete ventricosum]
MEGQRDAKNATLIQSVITLEDSKLWVICRGSASMKLYRGSSLLSILHNG